MFRTFLICIALMILIAAVVAGVVARASEKSPVAAASTVKPKARRDGVKSTSGPQRPAGKNAPVSDSPKKQTAKTAKDDGDSTGAVKLSGESVVGDQNAPKSLVLVPWKSAKIGKMPGLSMLLDDSVRPVDKDVFMRELAYYRIRVDAK